jgi:uroporphyrinogen decarboxylase
MTRRPHPALRPLAARSDILTPLPGLGVPFDIDDNKGPLIDNPVRTMEAVKKLHALDLTKLEFVGRWVGWLAVG